MEELPEGTKVIVTENAPEYHRGRIGIVDFYQNGQVFLWADAPTRHYVAKSMFSVDASSIKPFPTASTLAKGW